LENRNWKPQNYGINSGDFQLPGFLTSIFDFSFPISFFDFPLSNFEFRFSIFHYLTNGLISVHVSLG